MSAPVLDPDFAREAARLEDYGVDWEKDDVAALRRAYDRLRTELAGEDAAGCTMERFEAGGIRGIRFEPAQALPGRAILYFHGGSWCVGSPETHRVPCSHLAAETGLTVWSADYRLAPEHPFPAQREDGVAVATALLTSGQAERLVLSGDSAGAAVALWTDAALPPDLRARIDGIAAFYGGYGTIPDGSAGGEDDDTGLSPDALIAAYARLGPIDRLAGDPAFCIPRALPADGPPCYISIGDGDPLLPESRKLATAFEDAGRGAVYDIRSGLGHSFLHYVTRVPAARDALRDAAAWIGSVTRA